MISETIDDIIEMNKYLADFWSNSENWAPSDVYEILSNASLRRQLSLSESLKIWVTKELSEGESVLAWVNLGILVENTLKLFLVIYLENYMISERVVIKKKGKEKIIITPNNIKFEALKVFFLMKLINLLKINGENF